MYLFDLISAQWMLILCFIPVPSTAPSLPPSWSEYFFLAVDQIPVPCVAARPRLGLTWCQAEGLQTSAGDSYDLSVWQRVFGLCLFNVERTPCRGIKSSEDYNNGLGKRMRVRSMGNERGLYFQCNVRYRSGLSVCILFKYQHTAPFRVPLKKQKKCPETRECATC